ncbi:MAG: heat shock protein HtpX [Candidatus Azotimanducaceae bacterium]|jgi:heat shock protein HtpX
MTVIIFIGTNPAVMVLVSITFPILCVEGLLAENGAGLHLYALLLMSVVIGFGYFISSSLAQIVLSIFSSMIFM